MPLPRWSPCSFTGMHLQSHWDLYAFTGMHPNPNQDAPLNLSPPFQVICFYTIYLTRDSTAQRVCSPGAGFNPPNFFVALWPTCVVLSRYVSSLVAATHLVIRKTSNKISRKNRMSKKIWKSVYGASHSGREGTKPSPFKFVRGIQTQILSCWLALFFDDAGWFKYV